MTRAGDRRPRGSRHRPSKPRWAIVLARISRKVPPAAGASVMATSIVSIGLSLDGHESLSRVLLAAAVVLWLGLATIGADRFVEARLEFLTEVSSPAALTVVADTAVLGSRLVLLRWTRLAEAALALAVCLTAVLMPRVLRAWARPTVGGSFMLAVSIESLAALAAEAAVAEHATWLAVAALALLVLGVGAYAFVLASFDFGQLLTGRGDHWVAGGALAIATFACARTAQASTALEPLRGLVAVLSDSSLALWAAAVLWLPALIVDELRSTRTAYDIRRWSTVFPFGMYAACSFVTARVTTIDGLTSFARIWVWVAVAVWAAVVLELLQRAFAPDRSPTRHR
jgi:tellurite resistance protein TehA-like permease